MYDVSPVIFGYHLLSDGYSWLLTIIHSSVWLLYTQHSWVLGVGYTVTRLNSVVQESPPTHTELLSCCVGKVCLTSV